MKLNLFRKKAEIPEDKHYDIGKYTLKLKHYHRLDEFQLTFPLYDRFLPLICSDLEGLIVDIGANVGDTSIGIFAKNDKSIIIGIEPDLEFFNDCLENINQNELNDRFFGINKFVTSKAGNYVIKRAENQMTGSIETQEGNQESDSNSIKFEDIFKICDLNKSTVFSLLKIDTDGFDWDIINTFYDYSLNATYLPVYIHFEMQTFLNNQQHIIGNRDEITDNYKKSLNQLKCIGYTHFCLFDNFGTHIKITQSIDEIFELNDYMTRSQLYNKYSTMFYIDILCFKESELKIVENKLKDLYKNENIA